MLTNNTGISLSLAVWLCSDSYDHSDDPNTISATTLLKPIREIVLGRQNSHLLKTGDISTLIASSMGTSLHDGIEASWLNVKDDKSALEKLGIPEKVRNSILINPTKEELYDGCIPVYLEKRSTKKVGNYTISGKFDLVLNGRLEDYKSTGVYSYIMQSNNDKHTQQGSIYRWINPDIITEDTMAIQYIFTDWSKLSSLREPKYPKTKLLEQLFNLMTVPETDRFVKGIVSEIDRLKDAKQADLPRCTDKELWVKPTVWKYYKDPKKTARSTKNFDNYTDASIRLSKDGSVGVVKEIKGQVTKCKYCNVVDICDQARELKAAGLLKIV